MQRRGLHKKYIIATAVILALVLAIGGGIAWRTKSTIHDIFKLNQQRKSEGYYLSEFEWEMLAAAHYLDTGHYIRSLRLLDAIHAKYADPEGLIRIPAFADDAERLRFYQSMQNPKTGAFLSDDSLPLFAAIGPTANMIALIAELSAKAGEPFRLNHPVTFLDAIDTPEDLTALLDEATRVGRIGALFKTPFVCVAELGSLVRLCERHGLYAFSPEWKKALYDWFYANQDPETGLWGPRSRSDNHLLHGGSLTESERVIKLFVDPQGNQLHPDYPLRYADRIIASALAKLASPMPDDLDELHEWILAKDHGTRFITRYLWPSASRGSRDGVRNLAEEFMELRFREYYVAADGAFSLYPDAGSADLDGTGEAIGMYKYLGILDSTEQQRLWGAYADTVVDLRESTLPHLGDAAFDPLRACPGVNSIRVYPDPPGEDLLTGVALVYYPKETEVPDAAVLLRRVNAWLATTPQEMGNWVTKDSIRERLQVIGGDAPPTFTQAPLHEADGLLQAHGQVVMVGFDLLQAPCCAITYRLGE